MGDKSTAPTPPSHACHIRFASGCRCCSCPPATCKGQGPRRRPGGRAAAAAAGPSCKIRFSPLEKVARPAWPAFILNSFLPFSFHIAVDALLKNLNRLLLSHFILREHTNYLISVQSRSTLSTKTSTLIHKVPLVWRKSPSEHGRLFWARP